MFFVLIFFHDEFSSSISSSSNLIVEVVVECIPSFLTSCCHSSCALSIKCMYSLQIFYLIKLLISRFD
jgi:hypothetical protein